MTLNIKVGHMAIVGWLVGALAGSAHAVTVMGYAILQPASFYIVTINIR